MPSEPSTGSQRTCIGCGAHAHRHALVRIVRSPDGAVRPDPTATLPGRGAWIHPDVVCIQRARARRVLARAFRTGNLPESVWDDVEELITTQ
nr:YlxR family protein [Actinomyces bouchesdurhonensis]